MMHLDQGEVDITEGSTNESFKTDRRSHGLLYASETSVYVGELGIGKLMLSNENYLSLPVAVRWLQRWNPRQQLNSEKYHRDAPRRRVTYEPFSTNSAEQAVPEPKVSPANNSPYNRLYFLKNTTWDL